MKRGDVFVKELARDVLRADMRKSRIISVETKGRGREVDLGKNKKMGYRLKNSQICEEGTAAVVEILIAV